MSAFDDLVGEYEQPSEVEIFLPAKVGSVGNKGGNSSPAGNAASPTDKSADAHAGTAPEPAPQLPEGSDADETPSVEEEVPAVAEDANTPAEDPDEDFNDSDAPVIESAQTDNTASQETGQPSHPVIPRKNGGLSFEGDSAYLKQFPRVLIDQMRDILRPRLGEAFARDISQVSIVTAFVMAAIGTDIVTDESTGHAAKAFRENDPKTDAIDKRTVALLEQQTRVEESIKKLSALMGDVAETTAVLEMGQAYALAERTALLDTDGVLPETIDVTQKRAVASRDNIRKRVKAQLRDEKIRAGRPIR
jgi:hypothetical protein